MTNKANVSALVSLMDVFTLARKHGDLDQSTVEFSDGHTTRNKAYVILTFNLAPSEMIIRIVY